MTVFCCLISTATSSWWVKIIHQNNIFASILIIN